MNYSDPKDLIFKTTSEAKAFAKWYLSTSPEDSADEEFESEQARDEHLERRFQRLTIQVDDLRNLHFSSPPKTHYEGQTLFKLVKESYDPFSLIGSEKKSTRFNYKDSRLFKNRVLYFGQDRDCCYAELFHLDFMSQRYSEFDYQPRAEELPRPRYKLYGFRVTVDNLLVVTSPSTFKALGLPEGVMKDEWLNLNSEYGIPSSSQILGAIVRAQGYNGILFTSSRHQMKNNLVLFEENVGEIKEIATVDSCTDIDIDQYIKGLSGT